MEETKRRASAANVRIAPGIVETDEQAQRRADLEAATKAAADFRRKQKLKAGGASPSFKLQVPPQEDDEIPVVPKKRVNVNKPSEPF